MKTRILTAVVAVPLLIAAFFAPAFVWAIVVFVASLIGLYEFCKATGLTKSVPLFIASVIPAVYFPVSWYASELAKVPVLSWVIRVLFRLPFASWYVLLLLLIMIIFNKKVTAKMVGLTLLSALYIPYLLSHIIGLRLLDGGEYYIWLIIICAFMTDSFAYFTGRAFGRRKLCPNLSPNKTVAGAIGGLLGCCVSCAVFGLIISRCFGQSVDFISITVLGFICSVAAQLGDLAASAIKRQFGIKDYGNIIPGHGGILDRCDSIIFVAPIMFYYIAIIGIIR